MGSVRGLVDATGVLLNQINYDSFGKVLTQTNTAAGDSFLFTGRELDAATQQYFYRARYYSASTGRFTQQDPIGFRAGDTNLYRYVGNRVLNATDPAGTTAVIEYLQNLYKAIKAGEFRVAAQCAALIFFDITLIFVANFSDFSDGFGDGLADTTSTVLDRLTAMAGLSCPPV